MYNPYEQYQQEAVETTTETLEYDKEGRVVKRTVVKTVKKPLPPYGPTWTDNGFSYSHMQYK
jgi:hypothetical protein